MLGYLLPDALQRLFVSWVSGLPLRLQTLCFATLCAAVLIVLGLILRALILHVDSNWAYRTRLSGSAPSAANYALGWLGDRQAYFVTAIAILFVVSAGLFDIARSGWLPGDADSFIHQLIRTTFLCLRPGSGSRPDNLLSCPIFG